MIAHLFKPRSSASLTLANRTVVVPMTRKNTVGSVGLEGGDVIGALRDGLDVAESAALDAIEQRLSRDEFDLVAVGRALPRRSGLDDQDT
jgi:2,4-dienoyl-CoA reductase-like NADH-dependent reductase (Old Yellow Enzyme family)